MAKREAERYGMAVVEKYRDNAYNTMSKYNLDTRSQWQKDFDQNHADFNNYLSSGNYSVDNNKKYRDMATQAVADLDAQMKRYGTNSNEYKKLKEYKTYYQNALPTFDRLDVGANVQDYLSYDQDKGFTNWHSQDDYNTQKSYLDQQRQAVQTELDAIEDQTSVDYQNLKSWQDQLDMYANALEERNNWDKQFEDVNDYTAYERAGDYKNSIQAKQTLKDAQDQLKETEARLKAMQMKFAAVTDLSTLDGADAQEYQDFINLQQDYKQLQENVTSAAAEVAGLEKWQKNTATYNLLSQYGEDADYEQILNDLRAAREKAQEGSEDWAKIDLQIRAIAGENEDGLNENGQYDDSTLLGRSIMRDFDVDAAQKRLDEIDQELKDLGVSTSRFWGGVTNADNVFGVDAAGMIYKDENAVGESDPRVMALRQEKTELTRKMNSAEKFQEKDAAETAFKNLSDEDHAALQEEGLKHISQKGNNFYRDGGYDPTQSSGMLENFQYLDDELGGDIRDMLIEAVGAEALGRDIGYTVDDIMRLYQGDINHIAGKKEADKISAMDSDFARWNRQVLGVGTQAGLNQFVTGIRQAFSDDYIEPNKTSYKAQYTREDLKRYGDENFINGSNVSQVLFDTTQTTANMLPMIAASYLLTKAGAAPVVGELVGAGLMGVSSGGNTYQQALAEGWDKTDAKAYSTILGAAEGAMQYLIGGISGLGGVTEDSILKAAQGINNAAVRFATETGVHILSETTEELAQNRLQRYLDYKLGATDDADWMSWDDDDWYTVIVTALSTGAMEGLPGGINAVKTSRLGNQLAGNAIPGKANLKSSQANNELITEIGKAMQGNEALHETLTTIGLNLMEEGSEAYDLAERMQSGKAAKSAWNYGTLYSEILSEYQARNGKNGTADAMAAVIGGAIKYHELKRAEDTVSQAKEQAAQVRRENPGAEVLEANASALATMGVGNAAQATEYGALANKVLSGTNLSDAEMQKLLGDSTAAKATRVLLSRQSSNHEALRELNLSLTRGNTEAAKAAINSQIEEVRAAKQLQRQANIEAVAQAAAEAADRSAVSAAAANAERSPAAVAPGQERVVASTVKAVQKADTELEAATRRLEQLKKMSFKELANSKLLGEGGAEILVNAATDQDMQQQMATLQNRAEKLSAVRFPSQAQRTELADIREQQAALKEQIVANAESVRGQLEARASANASRGSANVAQGSANAASAEAAQITSADTIIVPGTGARMSREGFVQDYMAQNPGVTLEQANERFDQYAEQTGAVTKGTVENGQTADQDQERNDVGERGDRTEDQGRSNQSEQAAERSGADEFEELRTDGSRPEDAPAARVTKGASRVTDDNIEVITDDYADLPELTASLKRSGFSKITYILDGDLVNDLGDSVAAVYNNGELFLRLDYPQPGYDYVGTAEHERLHLKLELMRAKFGDEDGKAFVSTTLQSLLGREAFTKAFDAYAKVYGPVYLASGLSVDEVAHMICEEMLCDMVGGINNFGTDLGDYLEDAEGILEASKFNVVMQNLVDNPSGDPGTVIMEEIDKNALPYGIPADTLISSENVGNPSTQPADASQVSKYAFFGLAEALGFKVDQTGSKNKVYYLNDEDAKLGRNGFTQITVDMIKQSPIGDLIRYSVDKGDITADEAEQQYNLFASIASITDQTHDFYQAMQFMGSTIFTAMKANSDKQYGTTYDFPSICTKTQATINEMSAQMVAKGRSLTEDEIIAAYNNVFNDGNPVPCPECYVFSRWVGIGGLLDNIKAYQDRFGKMSVDEVIAAYDEANKEVLAFAEENGLSKGRAKGSLASKLDKQFKALEESIQTKENQGEAVAEKDYETRDKLAARMSTIRSLTWIDEVYFAGKEHKTGNVNPNFSVPINVLYDLNEGETFARDYKEAWAFRTTQGAGYGKAITPYAEAILGEGMLVTTNTTKTIKAKANGNLNNPYQTERGRITENSARGKNLKAARQKELNQLFIGGQRLQSTSDARFDNAVDYLLSALELQAMHSGAQVYTKVPGAVAFFNACKYCTNMSMMPKGGGLDANGNPVDTNVGGMDLATMMMLRKRFEYAGSITIGVNDAHIRALMAQEFRDFIIPYHASGGKMTLIESFRQTQDPDLKGTTIRSSDYTKTQSDKILNDDVLRDSLGKSEKEIEDIHKFRDTRLWILTDGKSGAYHSEILNPYEDGITEAQSNARRVLQGMYASMQEGGKWNGVKLAKGKVENQIFPNEFWDVSSTYENSSVNTQRYLDYCDALGFLHRFSGKTVTYNRKTGKSEIVPVTGYDQNGNKIPLTDLAYKNGTDGEIEPFFWKTLTDRRMYGNNGQYLEQPNVDLTNLKAETVTTFAAPMGERRYNHRVSMTNAAARAANVSRNSIQSLPDGRKYVKLDGNIFLNEDGSEMSPSQAYNRLVGTSITTEDGDTITFVNRLDGVRVRDELFRKRPGYSEGVDPDAVGQEVNRNIVEAIQASSATERNQAQTHPKPSVSDFDVRDVLVADDNAAYNIKFSIANLNDGTKVAYAKKYISAEPDVFEEIKKAETMAKVPESRLETETGRKHPDSQSGAEATELQPVDSITPSASEVKKEIEPIEEVPAEAVTEEVSEGGRPIPRYSMRETDPETLKFLNDQLEKGEVVRAYKTFLELTDENGNVQLYPPMATVQTGEDGKRKMANAMAVGAWEKSVGNPNSKNIFYDKKKDAWYYNLVKDNGGSVPAAYDPYQHSSNVVLNDQFESAYQRPNLATYEVVIPQSELTSGYHYEATRDDGQVVRAALPVGEHPWKKGIVAGKLKNTDRTVYMTRWLMPVRKVENSEVAQMYKEILDREDSPVAIPFNVVPPGLQEALERAGVPIDYEGSGQYKSWGKRYGTDRFPAGKPIAQAQSRYSIAGPGATTANSESLREAQRRVEQGESTETVRKDTGWFQGMDGKWRFEIDNSEAFFDRAGHADITRRLREIATLFSPSDEDLREHEQLVHQLTQAKKGSTVGDYLYHPGLFEAYPQLAQIGLKFGNLGKDILGEYRASANEIVISKSLQRNNEMAKSVLLHELQHAIQRIEGFAYGRQAGTADYRTAPGEIEARDVQARLNYTPEQRRMRPPNLGSADSRYSIQNDGTENTNPYPENTLQHDMLEAARNGTLSEWVTEQMNAHEDALENAKIRPPVIPSKGFVPKVTAKEKAALENRRKGLIQAKGAMKPSEKSNGFAMPKKDEAGNWFHRFLQNVGSAKELKVAQDQVEKFAFTDVAGTYTPDSNKADLNWAKNVISEDGLDSAVKQFNREAMKMEMPSNVTKSLALGQQLLIETSRQGDMQKFLDVLSSLTLLSSQAGKSLQAFRMLKQSGPIGELYYVQKAVGQLNDRHADKITAGRMSEITVPEDLANAVLMASTQEAQDKAMDELIAGIAAQVPVTLMDKWNAWRYMAMLGNARTHVRNIIGNAVFVPLRFAKDLMAAGGELLATKTGLMEEQDRRKALVVSRELRDFAKQDALAMQKELQGSGKYNPAREILDARKILPGFLETISRKNGELLEYEDWLFLSPAYQGALSQALAHTGYSLSEMLDGSNKDAVRALNNARRIAIEEAQKATYRDFNAAASMLNRIKRMESGKTSDKVIGVLLEGILPFTKTPINILRRGVEYSPIGIASSIFEAAAGVKNGNLDVAQFIDHLSAGLSGTAVAVLGYLLASLGYIRNKKDDKEEEFDKLQGYQDYSIQIGKVSATIDWAAPTALPLFTGAAAYDMIQRDEGLEWKDAWDAMMMIAEPMMSLSMLDGLNSTLSAASYADDSQKLATVASSAFTSYLGQAFPTLLGQVARSIDGTRRSTYVDKNSPVPTAIQRFVQSSVQNKIPVWEEQKIPYIDQWGREDTVSSKFLGAMENFLSPSYVNIVHTTDVDEALRDLYDTTKDSGVLPSTVSKYFNVAGERKDLTADEYVSYAKDVGSTKYQLLTSLFADPRYMSLTDDQKAEAVSVIYKYATAAGKYHVDQNYDLHAQGKWIEEAEAAATDVQRFNRIWEYLEEHFKK